MVTPLFRHMVLGGGLLMMLHLLLSIHPTYRSKTSGFSYGSASTASVGSPELDLTSGEPPTLLQLIQHEPETRRKANAVFVVLVRNSEMWGMLESMKHMEDRFNVWAKYDYVFLNDEPFTDEFKLRSQALTGAKCHYGLINPVIWNQPDWIDEERAARNREHLLQQNIPYADSISYRNMCRFESGYFFRHPLLAGYDYYWRLEPGVQIMCDVTYDPFLFMMDENKVYGFAITLWEIVETIPSLWKTVVEFVKKHPEYLVEGNAEKFVTTDNFTSYNRCHFWSNFEIGDLNFWRSEAYMKFFEHLEQDGGFYYERWGDAPVHTIAAALFAKKEQIHFFEDIGYRHLPFQHCPSGDEHTRLKCWCDPSLNMDWQGISCLGTYLDLFK